MSSPVLVHPEEPRDQSQPVTVLFTTEQRPRFTVNSPLYLDSTGSIVKSASQPSLSTQSNAIVEQAGESTTYKEGSSSNSDSHRLVIDEDASERQDDSGECAAVISTLSSHSRSDELAEGSSSHVRSTQSSASLSKVTVSLKKTKKTPTVQFKRRLYSKEEVYID